MTHQHAHCVGQQTDLAKIDSMITKSKITNPILDLSLLEFGFGVQPPYNIAVLPFRIQLFQN
jgi:hypothetical protein